MEKIEDVILRNLIFNEDFSRKTLPYFRKSFFSANVEKGVFGEIEQYILKYNNLPSTEALKIAIGNLKGDPDILGEMCSLIDSLEKQKNTPQDQQWLLDEAEKFCQEKAIYNAVLESIEILDDKKGTKDRGAIPQLLQDALGVSFDTSIGHDYLDDAEERFDFYHRIENKIAFDLEYFNLITNGGVTRKTLNVILAGTNVGKSLAMCHMAANYLSQGLNVLYITLEMAEEAIAQRIDANLFNLDMNDIIELPKDTYEKKIGKLRDKITGKLIIKEYPTAGANAIHFRNLVNELFLKRNFKPDVIFVDYINICSSARIKPGGQSNMYLYVKSIAEELRGLMVEFNVAGWTATQLNREGFGSSDPDLTNTAESFGLPATADLMFVIVSNEELEALNQWMITQLKNRYQDKTKNKRFCIGVDIAKMKLYDLEESAQNLTGQEEEVKPDDKKAKFSKLKTE